MRVIGHDRKREAVNRPPRQVFLSVSSPLAAMFIASAGQRSLSAEKSAPHVAIKDMNNLDFVAGD